MEGHGLDWEPPLSHGFKVGVGTVASLALWEEALKLNLADFDVEAAVLAAPTDDEVANRVRELLEPRIAQEAVAHSVGKNLQGDALRRRIHPIQARWPDIQRRAAETLISPEQAALDLQSAAAPYHPVMINIDWDRFRKTYTQAQMIRPRYTIFDLLMDLGIFEETVDKLFAPEGFWGRHRTPDTFSKD